MDNGTTWNKLGGGGMPILNYANPLFTFDSNNLSYTPTKDCYVCGNLGQNGNDVTLSIHGTTIARAKYFSGGRDNCASIMYHIGSGDTVTLSMWDEASVIVVLEEA